MVSPDEQPQNKKWRRISVTDKQKQKRMVMSEWLGGGWGELGGEGGEGASSCVWVCVYVLKTVMFEWMTIKMIFLLFISLVRIVIGGGVVYACMPIMLACIQQGESQQHFISCIALLIEFYG